MEKNRRQLFGRGGWGFKKCRCLMQSGGCPQVAWKACKLRSSLTGRIRRMTDFNSVQRGEARGAALGEEEGHVLNQRLDISIRRASFNNRHGGRTWICFNPWKNQI